MSLQTSNLAISTIQRRMPAMLGAGSIIAVIWAASVGSAGGAASIATVLYLIFTASLVPLLYLTGAVGFGVHLQTLIAPKSSRPWAIRTGLGLAAMLTLTQLLGITGLLFAQPIALAFPMLGTALLIHRVACHKEELSDIQPSPVWLAAIPAIGVLFAAACSPPGWLWASEFGGYDVLSYHLQLPRDWIALGTIKPVKHNVYSYLPSYLESAFTHIAIAMGAASNHSPTGEPTGIIANDGAILIACKLLHAWITIIAGMLTASAGSALCQQAKLTKLVPLGGAIAGAIVIATPWSVVTGSMAYNEMGVIAFFAAAMVVVLEPTLRPSCRGLLAGVLVGAACGCKPTALLFCAPAVGIALLWTTNRRLWFVLTCTACASGLLMLSPWLVRNTLAGGNPVFPQLTGIFGSAHWSDLQTARYKSGHSFDGSIFDAFRLLILPDPGDPAAHASTPIHRGLMHRQWSLLLPMTLIALLAVAVSKDTRKLAAMLASVLVLQLIAWLFLTHIQSRFLMPMLVPMGLAIALAITKLGERLGSNAAACVGMIAVLVPSTSTVLIFTDESTQHGGPNTATVFGARFFTMPTEFAQSPQDLAAAPFINSQLPPDAKVLLIGSATPLYIARELIYTTTWDNSLLAELIAEDPNAPSAWTAGLKNLGVTHIFLDLGELARLSRSGWADPLLDIQLISDWLAHSAVPIYRNRPGNHLIFELP